jgi:hypothetical protein
MKAKKRQVFAELSHIVEVLGLEGSDIDCGIARVISCDNVLFDQLHEYLLLWYLSFRATFVLSQTSRRTGEHQQVNPARVGW